ncbi:hypothetical protein FRC00_006239 [Tulasnella sp. 408]|nr:hypothetical protein FRC00_006239 [Tulasnella sp. 408]
MVVGTGRAAAESSSEDEAAEKKGFFAMKKNDKSGKGRVWEVEGPPPGGLAGGFLMRKKTAGNEQTANCKDLSVQTEEAFTKTFEG